MTRAWAESLTRGVSAPDAKQSSIYALELDQGGLSLPDRDYYLKESFAAQRQAYREHVAKMFTLLGEKPEQAAADAGIVLDLETDLAKASRSRVELRDPDKNYNKFTKAELLAKNPAIAWTVYLSERGLAEIPYAIVGQPEFFEAVDKLLVSRPLSDWKVYLRWHVLHAGAPFLCRDAEEENFQLFRQGPQRAAGAGAALETGLPHPGRLHRRGGGPALRGEIFSARGQGAHE